jgi:hypothetical protein
VLIRIAACNIFLVLTIQNKAAILDEVFSSINDFFKIPFSLLDFSSNYFKKRKSGLPPHLHSFSFFVCKGNTKFRFATPLQTLFS